MKILIAAIGRLRDGHEAALTADYLQRAASAGRQLGFKAVDLIEVEAKPNGDPRAEASALFRATPDGSRKILLDERGAEWASRQLAEKLAFGRQTWPHRLVRVMISEQIYRAVTILSGNPYHRD